MIPDGQPIKSKREMEIEGILKQGNMIPYISRQTIDANDLRESSQPSLFLCNSLKKNI